MHGAPGDTIRVANIESKDDCRAYRVFQYYIDELIEGDHARMPADTDAAEAERNVFLCEPHTRWCLSSCTEGMAGPMRVHRAWRRPASSGAGRTLC